MTHILLQEYRGTYRARHASPVAVLRKTRRYGYMALTGRCQAGIPRVWPATALARWHQEQQKRCGVKPRGQPCSRRAGISVEIDRQVYRNRRFARASLV